MKVRAPLLKLRYQTAYEIVCRRAGGQRYASAAVQVISADIAQLAVKLRGERSDKADTVFQLRVSLVPLFAMYRQSGLYIEFISAPEYKRPCFSRHFRANDSTCLIA